MYLQKLTEQIFRKETFFLLIAPLALFAPHLLILAPIFLIRIRLNMGFFVKIIGDCRRFLMSSLLLIALSFFSLLWSIDPKLSLISILKLIPLPFLGVFFHNSLTHYDVKKALGFFLIGFLLCLFFILINHYSEHFFENWRHVTNAKALAHGSQILAISLPMLLSFLWQLKKRIYAFLSVVLFYFAIVTVDCDAAWLAPLVGGCLSFLIVMGMNNNLVRSILLTISFLIITSFPFALKMGLSDSNLLALTTMTKENSYIHRLYALRETSKIVLEKPLLGYGINSSKMLHLETKTISWTSPVDGISKIEAPLTLLHPHNFILNLWLDLGVIGAILGMLLVLVLLKWCYNEKNKMLVYFRGAFILSAAFIASVSTGLWQNWWLVSLIITLSLIDHIE
jgi:O-antigen ligase